MSQSLLLSARDPTVNQVDNGPGFLELIFQRRDEQKDT